MENYSDESLAHMLFLAKHLRPCSLENMVTFFLLELNVPVYSDGYKYLKEAIFLFYQNPGQKLTKEIYPAVAKRFGPYLRPAKIEKSIRSAIEAAWGKRDEKYWRRLLPVDAGGNLFKPTNSQFISAVAAALELWKVCCEAQFSPDKKETVS